MPNILLNDFLKKTFLSEQAMLLVIGLNAIVIFLMAFPEWRHNETMMVLDEIFIGLFVVEAIVKMNHLSVKTYFSSSWNRFDFVVVLVSLPAVLAYFIELPNLSFFLLLRLARLGRLLRIFDFVPNLKHIIIGVKRAFRASIFVFAILAGIAFIFAILGCHFWSDVSPQYFGNPITAIYTIFQLFTIEGWNEIPPTLVTSNTPIYISAFVKLYFVVVVFMGGILGMSLANAIFVDEMTIDNNEALEVKIDKLQEQMNRLQELLEKK